MTSVLHLHVLQYSAVIEEPRGQEIEKDGRPSPDRFACHRHCECSEHSEQSSSCACACGACGSWTRFAAVDFDSPWGLGWSCGRSMLLVAQERQSRGESSKACADEAWLCKTNKFMLEFVTTSDVSFFAFLRFKSDKRLV